MKSLDFEAGACTIDVSVRSYERPAQPAGFSFMPNTLNINTTYRATGSRAYLHLADDYKSGMSQLGHYAPYKQPIYITGSPLETPVERSE